jgi:hypothetical protein
MEDQKINITVENGVKELVIRQGEPLPVPELERINLEGTIDASLRFLEKHYGIILFDNAYCVVNREELKIYLRTDCYNETDKGDSIIGKLTKTKEFESFGINTGKNWLSRDFGQFVKMNRSCFESKDIANELAAKLTDFKAKVEKETEDSNDNRGNKRFLKAQVIKSCNIPEKFNLQIPIFKGAPKVMFEVEIYIDAESLTITLVSPGASDIIAQVRDESIDTVLDEIKALCPQLVIIEQ